MNRDIYGLKLLEGITNTRVKFSWFGTLRGEIDSLSSSMSRTVQRWR